MNQENGSMIAMPCYLISQTRSISNAKRMKKPYSATKTMDLALEVIKQTYLFTQIVVKT